VVSIRRASNEKIRKAPLPTRPPGRALWSF